MGHSTVWNAGQRYRSSKKRGLTGQKLEALRSAMSSRKRKAASEKNVPKAKVFGR